MKINKTIPDVYIPSMKKEKERPIEKIDSVTPESENEAVSQLVETEVKEELMDEKEIDQQEKRKLVYDPWAALLFGRTHPVMNSHNPKE
ncbi:hypothetical protein [Bacillus suaedae]|uniref:Uncharacterized protein n=1 Tax=Halalkalibacter suaedae TaxID=2822140 RepID=A0A940WV31_9BACI|nr:hypothetical protein [Bacillus suaedae]MBP3951022.1 hypothetical protein [Bacillus suaedae]